LLVFRNNIIGDYFDVLCATEKYRATHERCCCCGSSKHAAQEDQRVKTTYYSKYIKIMQRSIGYIINVYMYIYVTVGPKC
jgi:hypothetical protein